MVAEQKVSKLNVDFSNFLKNLNWPTLSLAMTTFNKVSLKTPPKNLNFQTFLQIHFRLKILSKNSFQKTAFFSRHATTKPNQKKSFLHHLIF
jgi:hypothetical protein